MIVTVREAMNKAYWRIDILGRLGVILSFCAGGGFFLFWVWMEWDNKYLAGILSFVVMALFFFIVNYIISRLLFKWQVWALENVRNVHELRMRGEFHGYWLEDNSRWISSKQKQRLRKLEQKFETTDVPEPINIDCEKGLENVVTNSSIFGEKKPVLLMTEAELIRVGGMSIAWCDIQSIIVMVSWQSKRPNWQLRLVVNGYERPLMWKFENGEIAISEEELESLLRAHWLLKREGGENRIK